MKKNNFYLRYSIWMLILILSVGCNDSFLDVKPTDKITGDALFASQEGIDAYLANLYRQIPIEDFNATPEAMNYNPGDANNAGRYPFIFTDNGIGSENSSISPSGAWDYNYWENGYRFNKEINLLKDVIDGLTSVSEEVKRNLMGQVYFMKAYNYYALAKRYGGVPLITETQDFDNVEGLYVPRNTEEETWDYVLAVCDSAALFLDQEPDPARRKATKWVALALKSRASLHAASVAKFWDKYEFTGESVDKGLVGMSQSAADKYYAQCVQAGEEIIKSGYFSLFKANPANPEEATENYRLIFEDPNNALDEVIFLKGFNEIGAGYGSNQDNWGNPNQTRGAWPHPGRFNPTLDLIDTYETYDKPGRSVPIVTTKDGVTEDYSGYSPNKEYLAFDDPQDIFKGKDARMFATVIVPNSIWKDTKIIIQGGYIQPDGKPVIMADESIDVNGKTYYTFGASDPALFSGFSTFGGNMTRTGFGFKKFLDSSYTPRLGWNFSTTDWIDFRYPEVLLDYAEAVLESGLGDPVLAAEGLNMIRKRAAHKTDIPLTIKNVLRERRLELVYENKRYWDLVRRREYHELFTQRERKALVPILDLRTMKYIFIRTNVPRGGQVTFNPSWYYKPIPGVGTSGLIQNPHY